MKNKKNGVKILLACVVLLLVAIYLAACGIHYFEKEAQPKAFGSLLDTMRYTFLTLTTVGYGDMSPTTTGGRVITILVGVTGSLVSIVVWFTAIVFGARTLIRKFG